MKLYTKQQFSLMYILAPTFFEKDDNMYLKLEIRVVCRELLVFKYLHIYCFFFPKISLIIYICNQKSRKLAFKAGILGTQYPFVFV